MMGLRLLSEFSGKAAIAARRQVLRARRKLSVARGLAIPGGFFDQYPLFYSTSQTAAIPNRLNQRYRACIEWNEAAIRSKRILDLASHDGRWSFAAMKAGATSVVGIEARDYLVHASGENLIKYGIPENSFRFIAGDVFERLDQIEPNSVDTVLCLGFFYHVANHMLLLSKIARLKPKYLILDTALYLDPYSVIVMYADPEGEANAFQFGPDATKLVIAGAPSKSALELMLSNFGWSFAYYDWHRAGIRRWDDIVDYQEGWRVTLRVRCTP
jgi:16S rRNA G966 N2-methylase RsmD